MVVAGPTHVGNHLLGVPDNGLGFDLVPWTPSLERHTGREVVGIARAGRIEWTFARSRGLGIG